VNEPAMIYRNTGSGGLRHHLDVELRGPEGNIFGVGAKVAIRTRGKQQYGYCSVTKGFESGSLGPVHFGLGREQWVDSVEVVWPDGKVQLLTEVRSDRRLVVDHRDAAERENRLWPHGTTNALLVDVTDSIGLRYRRPADPFNDLDAQPLMPHQLSKWGPKMAVADIDGDGLDDLFICGGVRQAGSLFRQEKTGRFVAVDSALFAGDGFCLDADAVFADVNGDGRPDLVVVS